MRDITPEMVQDAITELADEVIVPWNYGETVKEAIDRVPEHPSHLWILDRIEEDYESEVDRWLLHFRPGRSR